jgi:hypothetical protein
LFQQEAIYPFLAALDRDGHYLNTVFDTLTAANSYLAIALPRHRFRRLVRIEAWKFIERHFMDMIRGRIQATEMLLRELERDQNRNGDYSSVAFPNRMGQFRFIFAEMLNEVGFLELFFHLAGASQQAPAAQAAPGPGDGGGNRQNDRGRNMFSDSDDSDSSSGPFGA